ncbi:MAG TPA: hypothetical protein VF591_22530 [Pyrinomonadaceae bacterium]|jgi:hypothetical protein
MQNYNNPAPPPPQGGYGMPPQPPAKKGMSTGVKVLIVALVLVVGGGVLVVALAVGGLVYFSRQAQGTAGVRGAEALKGLKGGAASGGAEAEPPSPTAEQQAAIAGGQEAEWPQQEISWTVPQKWKKYSAESTTFLWRSPGTWDAASLIVNVSPMAADFPAEVSLAAFYTGAEQRKKSGEVDEVRWVKLDGVKGVLFRESAPENSDSPQRLQWMGYRDYKGQKQLVNVMLAAQGKYFARHEDAMYGILYSTDLGR